MRRFTEKREEKNVIPLRNAVCGIDMPHWCISEKNPLEMFLSGDAVDRLAAYEDSGLEPEEVELGPICAGCDGKIDGKRTSQCPYPNVIEKCFDREKHIISLLKSEAKGRVVELPCKVGDMVFYRRGTDIIGDTVERIVIDGMDNQIIVGAHKAYTFWDWGRNVFATREEAEAELKEKTNE